MELANIDGSLFGMARVRRQVQSKVKNLKRATGETIAAGFFRQRNRRRGGRDGEKWRTVGCICIGCCRRPCRFSGLATGVVLVKT